jgi:hypothetical protein
MKTPPERFFGVFAVFFTAVFPLFAGVAAARTHNIFVDATGRVFSGSSAFAKLPAIPDFIFNNFRGLLLALFVFALAITAVSFLQGRVKDPVLRLARQFTLAFASAFVSLVFLVFYILAFTHLLAPAAY